ncbi:MAG TPA: class I SAM-dependent methyltransferase [Pyrinomonadaceae bacterium]|jgi:SAM-dependent methyltransferase
MKKDFAQEYGDLEQWHWWFRGRRKILEFVLREELSDAAVSRRILSVGCGPAPGLKWLSPFAGVEGKVFGLDIEPLHARGVGEGLGFVVGSLETAPLRSASFDVVVALDVLEHLDDDHLSLCEAVRLVKPGGLLLLTVPALPSLWGGQDVVSEHRRRYTRRTLRKLFDDLSLSGYWIKYFNTFLFPLAASVRLVRRVIGKGNRARSDFEDNRPGIINETLAWLFGAESFLIRRAPFPFGVSLVATYRPPLQDAPKDTLLDTAGSDLLAKATQSKPVAISQSRLASSNN